MKTNFSQHDNAILYHQKSSKELFDFYALCFDLHEWLIPSVL